MKEIQSAIKVNGLPVKAGKFNGGEIHVVLPQEILDNIVKEPFEELAVTAVLKTSDDIMQLILVNSALESNHIEAKIKRLYISYLPYARQDRACNEGEACSIKAMAGLINSMKFDSVGIVDVHSDVSLALIDNVAPTSMTDIFVFSSFGDRIKEYCPNLVLVAPDAGAEKKVRSLAKALDVPMVCASKVRDSKTGNIINTEIHDNIEPENDYLIVDDICDGGRTFIELAKVLRQEGATKVMLYVTHGIFSNGLEVFDAYIDEVFCTNTLDYGMTEVTVVQK